MTARILFAAAIGLMATLGTVPAVADALDDIIARKTIRVAVPTDYPPFGSVGADMQPRGMDIDVANLIGEKLGVKVELVPVTAPNRVAYLQSGKTDLTISSLGKTEERAKVIDFSIAYSPFFDAVFGKKEPPVKDYADLSDKTISVTRGSMQDKELEDLAPKAVVKRFEDNNSTIAAFMSGQVEMFASGTPVAAAIKRRNPDLDLELKIVLANSPCYVGVVKGETKLLDKVNAIIREAKASGEIDRLSVKWLGAPAGELPE
ncbi:transporter substrate-binding domain-containing protein [Ancylobacter sp. FA202]|uniref:transporter substrate-binding domain-containing protein n=1 Tax=Ancylobacter sp. FA202 TaxID=1111106 RepID=UPI0003768F18|nr:transporter substrate-binding domain-containing protein [Ancylobacter sp. FA202]